MKTIYIDVYLNTGFVGCNYEDTIEVYIDKDDSEEEIIEAKEEAAREWAMNCIEYGYSDSNKGGK